MIQLRDKDFLFAINVVLYRKLVTGAITGQLIDTAFARGIGKTTTLVEFAKEFDLIVFVSSSEIAMKLRHEFDYEKIVTTKMFLRGLFEYGGRCVVDECVDLKAVKELGFKIVTGFSDN